MAFTAEDTATIAQIVAASLAQALNGSMPSNGQHMADTVDNRRWIDNGVKVYCKGVKKAVEYRLGDKDGLLLSATPTAPCRVARDLQNGYCEHHQGQAGLDLKQLRTSVVIVPNIERPAIIELAKTLQKQG